MKAQDLRIGNWVAFLGNRKQILGITKRNQKMNTETTNHYIEFKEHIPVMISHIRPIPLTEEWLLKFGFEVITDDTISSYDYVLEFGDLAIQGTWDEKGNLEGVTFEGSANEWTYVHQLQNLYYLLTGKEII